MPSTTARSAGATPSTIPGLTCRSWRASLGALRNGAPFKDWVLQAALERIRRKLAGSDEGDRQMVKILAAVLSDGLPEVEAACAQALAENVHSADVVLNILARRRDPRRHRRSTPPPRSACATPRPPTAAATTH